MILGYDTKDLDMLILIRLSNKGLVRGLSTLKKPKEKLVMNVKRTRKLKFFSFNK